VEFNEVPYITGYEFTLKEIDELPDIILKIYFKDFALFLPTNESFLNFTLKLKIDFNEVRYYSDPSKELSELEKKSAINHLGAELLSKKVFEIIAASQIARPGSLALRDGIVTIQNIKYESIFGTPPIRSAFQQIVQKGYPIISFIEFPKFWNWLKANDLLFVKKPTNKYQVAINAFTHLFDSESLTYNLVYSMLALEALFVEGDGEITRQLNQKIQIFLGEIKDYKRQLKEMYKIRSEFFHGALAIKPKHRQDSLDGSDFEHHLEEATFLSIMVLIATLQKMYMNNMFEIHFELKLK
jgi:hypothetical protein